MEGDTTLARLLLAAIGLPIYIALLYMILLVFYPRKFNRPATRLAATLVITLVIMAITLGVTTLLQTQALK